MRTTLLVLLAATVAGAEDDLDALVHDIGSPSYSVRDRAYRTLTQRKDPRVIPKIEKSLPAWRPENQYRGLLVVGAFPPKRSHPLLRRLLKSKDPHLRICGATQLHQRGERGMEPIMVETLRGPIPDALISSVVARVRYVRLPAVYDAWSALITPKRNARTLYTWFAALSSEGHLGATVQARALVATDTRAGPRAVACAYLIRCRDSSAAPELARIVKEQSLDSSAASRVRYLLRDGRIYPPELCSAIMERLPLEKSESVALIYIEILAAARHYPARKMIGGLVEHKNTKIAEAALGALAELSGVPETEVVRRMLDSDEPSRQLMAARILRRMDDASGFAITLDLARIGKTETIRNDAIRLLGEFRKAAAVELLIESLADENRLTRSTAARSLSYTLHAVFPFRRFDLRTAGYNAAAPQAERTPAVEKIRAWWMKNRDAPW